MKDKVSWDFWVCPRQMTKKWGCKDIYSRIIHNLGQPDIVFGKTDGIFNDVVTVDIDPNVNPTYLFDWRSMPFEDNEYNFGFWDPPYDKMYPNEWKEIWRVCKRVAVLQQLIVVRPVNCIREYMIAVTTGPYQRIRCLQVFRKKNQRLVEG